VRADYAGTHLVDSSIADRREATAAALTADRTGNGLDQVTLIR
jgi:hypothetical protein